MKDHVRELIRTAANPVQGKNILREYLQARILGFMQNAGAMIPLAFHCLGEGIAGRAVFPGTAGTGRSPRKQKRLTGPAEGEKKNSLQRHEGHKEEK